VGRPQLHSEDAIMDAARTVVLERGARGATIGTIATASGAPTGSIYHRFESIDELLARSWMRAMQRVQEALLSADTDDILEAAVTGALAVYDFCLRNRDDALLASSFRLTDFTDAALSDDSRARLERLNRRVDPSLASLAGRLPGTGRLDVALLAIRDLPYGAALPHIRNNTKPSAARRRQLEAAVRAVIGA
jgi:AcrR family transcriptional regulator